MTDASKPAGFIKPDTDTHVYFYEQDFYVLSNFSAFKVKLNVGDREIDFDTAEQAYHWLKFDHDFSIDGVSSRTIQQRILEARSAHDAFAIAQAFRPLRRPDWDKEGVKNLVMLRIIRAKRDQHRYVLKKLIQTGKRRLVEDSWRDDYWGWGPNKTGRDELGSLWELARAEVMPVEPFVI